MTDSSPDGSAEVIRRSYRENFEELNRRLAATDLDRYVRFFNWGYLPVDGEEPVGPRLPRAFPNADSAQLLFQLVGDLDLTGQRVIEVGCGRGGNLALLGDFLRVGSTVGLDLAHPSLVFGERIVNGPHLFVQGDAEELPFADCTTEVVLNVESSGCYPDIERFFREVARVLVPGGWFLYADYIYPGLLEAYHAALPQLGLELVYERDVTANVVAARSRRAERERLALGGSGPLDDWVGSTDSAMFEMLSSGAGSYWLLRLQRGGREPVRSRVIDDVVRAQSVTGALRGAELLRFGREAST